MEVMRLNEFDCALRCVPTMWVDGCIRRLTSVGLYGLVLFRRSKKAIPLSGENKIIAKSLRKVEKSWKSN